MPHPIVLDLRVGDAGHRVDFRLERMAHVDPWDFAAALQELVSRLIDEGEEAVLPMADRAAAAPVAPSEDEDAAEEPEAREERLQRLADARRKRVDSKLRKAG